MQGLIIKIVFEVLVLFRVFGRCYDRGHCSGYTWRGVCMECHGGRTCQYCKRVRQANGKYIAVPHENNASSHGICPECFEINCGPEHRERKRLMAEGRDCFNSSETRDETKKIFIQRLQFCKA